MRTNLVKIGLYGSNGHQIHEAATTHPLAKITAVAQFPEERLPPTLHDDSRIRRYGDLGALISDPEVDFVSLCSPRRADQASDAIRALRAGKHVLAEKPCALSEEDLDAVLATAEKSARFFHEMAGTAFEQPYFAMREICRSGQIGEIVQIVAEKSYPFFRDRPQDEAVDGGLIAQSAIHALRFVEHVACVRISEIRSATETCFGNPIAGGKLRMAASLSLILENGGLASIAANYLNPRGTGIWGDETLRILGTRGLIESKEGGRRTRLVVGDIDHGSLDTNYKMQNFWLDAVFSEIAFGKPMPLTLEEELAPTRWILRANLMAKQKSILEKSA